MLRDIKSIKNKNTNIEKVNEIVDITKNLEWKVTRLIVEGNEIKASGYNSNYICFSNQCLYAGEINGNEAKDIANKLSVTYGLN